MTGQPVTRIHFEPKTKKCRCPRIIGCGGLAVMLEDCPEDHGNDMLPRMHSHPFQVSREPVGTRFAV